MNLPGNQDKFVAMVTAKADVRLPLGEFQPKSMLVTEEHPIQQPRFPAIDYHNHLDAWTRRRCCGLWTPAVWKES